MDDLELPPDQVFSSLLREACGLFLSIYRSRIYFVHQTVEDYLLVPEAKRERPNWLREINVKDCHRTLAESCMRYVLRLIANETRFLSIEDYINAGTIPRSSYNQ